MARGQSAQYKRLKDEVALLALVHSTPSAILNALVDDADRLGIDLPKLPDERTIRNWLKEIRTCDTSGPWSPMAADPGQAKRVLPVLAEAVRSGGEKRWLTRDQAALADRVVLLAPTIPPRWAWALALGYQWARENKLNTQQGLDLMLAFQPWRSVQGATDWVERLREMGERAGGWPGGGPGLLALAAGELSPPDWASDKHGKNYWGAQLWQILTEGIAPLPPYDSELADSKLTAKRLDDGGQTETDTGKNPHQNTDAALK
jgi:hypothetical protein